MPPTCSATKLYIAESTKLILHWVNDTHCAEISIKALLIMPQLLFQKPFQNSKCKDHVKTLERRMKLWQEGRLEDLAQEARAIQQRLKCRNVNKRNVEEISNKFTSLMHKGKVNAALRLIDDNMMGNVLPLNDQTLNQLKVKHPEGTVAAQSTLVEGPIEKIPPVIFDEITGETVRKAVISVDGAAGPSGLDADAWTRLLTCRSFGAASRDLCNTIALMARKMCSKGITSTDHISDHNIEAFVACRLIPIDKNPGIRPIGIGEILRRIIGKSVMSILKTDVMRSAGALQLCAGHRAGSEAAVHAMRNIFENMDTEAVILVDANNAFNSLNRQAMLHNVSIVCPAIATYVKNCYGLSARLFIAGGDEILSSEGTTQGDPIAMAVYAIGVVPLISSLKADNRMSGVKLEAYADDFSGAGKLAELRRWWDKLSETGPAYGYFPNSAKSWLICKEEHINEAEEMFRGSNVQITSEGQRHLGAAIGSRRFKEEYVSGKVNEWINQLRKLSKIAQCDPQSAFSAFTFGLKHKWNYLIRTIPNISHLLQPLEDEIMNNFIPSLLGFPCNQLARDILALPARLGGMGLINPVKTADIEFQNSSTLTAQLVSSVEQQKNVHEPDFQNMRNVRKTISTEREIRQKLQLLRLREEMSDVDRRASDLAQETGASNWLTALPLKEQGFNLNKQEFRDAIAMRYGLPVFGIPDYCACGSNFNVDHAMQCKKGGFISQRHNEIRDLTANLLKEVCTDVQIEPPLLNVTGEVFRYATANTNQEARLDVSARGFWVRGQRAFFDARIFYPFAPSYRTLSVKATHLRHENEKRRNYNERVLQIEMGSFTPLVFSTSGGMAPECSKFYSRLAELISEKRNSPKSTVTAWMRCKLSYSLLRSAILCLRGSRTLRSNYVVESISETDFDVVVSQGRMAP